MTLADWVRICGHITRLWPHDPVKPDTAEAWYPLLADLDRQDVDEAVLMLRQDPAVRFAPTPGQLREACRPSCEATWTDALPEISRRLSQSTPYGPSGNLDKIARYIQTLGPLSGMQWSASDTSTRAQLRDWWLDDTKRRVTAERREVAQLARQHFPELEAAR